MASLSAGLAASLAGVPAARADQFVFLDVTFTYTKMDADTSSPDKSHYYVYANRLNPTTPRNWMAPINYRNGVVHVRTDVMDKPPGGTNVRWTLCYIPNKGIAGGYGCTNSALYSEKGVWEFEQSMTDWWQNEDIDWTQGIKEVDIVMKDGTGGSGFTNLRPDPQNFFPTTLRITMIQVSAGDTYDPSKVPGIPPVLGDGGSVTDASSADAGNDDAGSGNSGTGGGNATGTGGATAATGGAPGSGSGGAPGGGSSGAPGSSASGGASAGIAPGAATSGGCAIVPDNPFSGRMIAGLAFVVALSSVLMRRRRR
ncbi:MAG TPA: hypothetical protein VH374_07310 [Polyangia bacterium]|nr:hypothetical protein [Polyangia bacterium]